MTKIEFTCEDCNANYKITFDNKDFFTPEYCPFCTSGNIEIENI